MTSRKQELQAALQEAIAEQEQLEERLNHKPDVGLGKGSSGLQTWEMGKTRQTEIATKIEDLKAALGRVRKGTYGQCENCGSQIQTERLKILPTTLLCADCAGASAES